MVCEIKRIRSIYLPPPTRGPTGLSTTTPSKAPASLSTINAATMRLCGVDLPAPPAQSRLEAAPTEQDLFWWAVPTLYVDNPGPHRRQGGLPRLRTTQPRAKRGLLATSFDNLLEIPSGEEIPIVG